MTLLDAIIIIIFIVGVIGGMKQGVIKSGVALVGTIVVFVLAYYLKNPLAAFFYKILPFFEFDGAQTINILLYETIAFIIILGLLFLILGILIKVTGIIEKIFNATIILGFVSKLLGAIVGFIESYVLVFIMLFVLSQPFLYTEATNDSKIGSFILNKSFGLSDIVEDTSKSIKDVYELSKLYGENNKNKFNYESLKVLIKYDVITKDSVKTLYKKDKLDFNGVKEIINSMEEK